MAKVRVTEDLAVIADRMDRLLSIMEEMSEIDLDWAEPEVARKFRRATELVAQVEQAIKKRQRSDA